MGFLALRLGFGLITPGLRAYQCKVGTFIQVDSSQAYVSR